MFSPKHKWSVSIFICDEMRSLFYFQVWIDLLLAAGVDIEVCKVKCSNPDDASASNPKKLRESSASELSANVIELSDSKPLILKEELKVQPFKSAKNIAKVITILSSDDSDIEVFSSKKKDHLKS